MLFSLMEKNTNRGWETVCGSGAETKVNFSFKQNGEGRPHWEGDIRYIPER